MSAKRKRRFRANKEHIRTDHNIARSLGRTVEELYDTTTPHSLMRWRALALVEYEEKRDAMQSEG